MDAKIWANSADSHFLEPEDLFRKRLPKDLADRMPHSVKEGDIETIYIDGETITRRMPKPVAEGEFAGQTARALAYRPPGAQDTHARLKDLDQEGIWGELCFPSLGMWANHIKDPILLREGCKAINDWAMEEIQDVAPERLISAAMLPLGDVQHAVDEVYRVKERGYHAVFITTVPPQGQPLYNSDYWEPLWSAVEETGLILTVHIGTDGQTVFYRGPGGAVMNYTETAYGGQRAATQLITGGALDRHPDIRVIIVEGGAAWVPFLGDRMNEGYRQHGLFVRPTLSKLPKEFLYHQVYVSFQHDVSAIPTVTAMGYENVMWGSDYPHLEGTYGHTQKTLHELFDSVSEDVRYRVTVGAFLDLFPHIGPPPAHLSTKL